MGVGEAPADVAPQGVVLANNPSLVVAERIFLGALCAWLVAAVGAVDVELYDGFDAISNAHFFLGRTPYYTLTRWPLLCLALLPGEAFKTAFDLSPLEVRPAHLTMLVLHVCYLLGTWALTRTVWGRSWASLLAFAAAVPTVIFFSYAPFVSHDVFPGLLFLALIVVSERFSQRPTPSGWMILVGLGAAGALIKPTYGIFWGATLVARALPTLLRLPQAYRTPWRSFALLVGAAVASGALFWISMGSVLGFLDDYAKQPFLLRPLNHITWLRLQHGDPFEQFWPWVYVANYPTAYGFLAAFCFIPGAVLCLRTGRLPFVIAVAWGLGFVAIQATPFREVRYLAFLCPLTGCVLVPVLARVLRARLVAIACSALLVVDLARGAGEAALIADPFYRHSELKALVEPLLDVPHRRRQNVLCRHDILTFVPSTPTPFVGDPYHRLFQFNVSQLVMGAAPQDRGYAAVLRSWRDRDSQRPLNRSARRAAIWPAPSADHRMP